jgi:hypothetical protein
VTPQQPSRLTESFALTVCVALILLFAFIASYH